MNMNMKDSLDNLRKTVEIFAEDNVSNFSDEEIINYASEKIESLMVNNSLLLIALENNMTTSEFERWKVLAVEKLSLLPEGDQLSDDDLLELLNIVRTQ